MMSLAQPKANRRAADGFTLIELLIVIALTLVLIVLLFGPMIQGLKYTSQAQTTAAAEDGQRLLLRQIQRDLASAAGVRDTQDKYLDVMVLEKASPTDSTGTQTLAHMYNAYTDIVPPLIKCQDTRSSLTGTCTETGENLITDPTTGQNLVLTTPSTGGTMPYGVTPGVLTPIAPGGSFTRYFVGLKHPFNLGFAGEASGASYVPVAQPYSNIYDNQTEAHNDPYYTKYYSGQSSEMDVVNGGLNNPYMLYVATVSPYTSGSTVNTALFQTDSSGSPILDDPDFFRIVTGSDLLPLTSPLYNSKTTTYGAAGNDTVNGTSYSAVVAHNIRVYNWYKAAHQVMGGRDYDLLGYARSGGNVNWAQPTLPAGATYTAENPLTQTSYGSGDANYVGESSTSPSPNSVEFDTANPIASGTSETVALQVRSLLTIVPAGYSGEGAKSPAPDDVSQGAQQYSNLYPGEQYIPTSYTISRGQVKGMPKITITADPTTTGVPTTYVTAVASSNDVGTTSLVTMVGATDAGKVAIGDMMEYVADSNNNPETPVFDVTQDKPVSGAKNYVAFTFDRTSGKLNFASAAAPATSGTKTGNADTNNVANSVNYNLWWAISLPNQASGTTYDPVSGDVIVQLDDTSYFNQNPFYPAGDTETYAPAMSVVVNSERVRGPDRSQSPSPATASSPINLSLVSYTRVPFGSRIGRNQYSIEYRHAVTDASGNTTYHPWIHLGQYTDWQAWLLQGEQTGTTGQSSVANTILFAYNVQNNIQTINGLPTPAPVNVSYATSSTMRVTLGLRVYDAFSGTAAFVNSQSDVPVGNGTR